MKTLMKNWSEEQTMIPVSTEKNIRIGSVLYMDEGKAIDEEITQGDDLQNNLRENQSNENQSNDDEHSQFDDLSVTDGIQIQLGEQDDTIVGEQAWDIPSSESNEFEQTISENARPVPIIRLKSKRAQRRGRAIMQIILQVYP